MSNLAILLGDQGKLSEAEPLYRDALRCRRETLGDTHPKTLTSMNNLAWFLHTLPGCAAEAVVLARGAVHGYEAALGAAHSETPLYVLDTLAAALEADGCAEEAAALRARIAAAESTADK